MKKFFASLVLCLAALSASAAEYPGVLAWKQRVVLSTPVSGVVTSVPAVAGERVREGQVLVQLDKRPFESALRKAEAQAEYDLELKTDFGDALVGQSESALLAARTEFQLAIDWARLASLTGEHYSPYLPPSAPSQPGNDSHEKILR